MLLRVLLVGLMATASWAAEAQSQLKANTSKFRPTQIISDNYSVIANDPSRLDGDNDPYANIFKAPLFKTVNGSVIAEAKVDESALRYYAAQKNKKRVDAETRRLKALYPSWNVPTDLYTPAGTGNGEQPLWDIYTTGNMLAVRAAIAARIEREPGWKPSFELTHKIDRKEATDRLIIASDNHQWARVLDIANAESSVITCASIDADWRVAEAFARLNMAAKTFDIYKGILATCIDKDERLATVRKSIAFLPTADVKTLIGMGEHRSDGTEEFETVKIDLVRARFGNIIAGLAPDDLLPEEIKQFGEQATKTKNVPDISMLGWYWFGKQKFSDSDIWFKLGLATEENAKLAEGHALSLRNLGVLEEAKKVAFDWRDRAPEMRALYVGMQVEELTRDNPLPVISPDSLKQFTDLIGIDHDANGAQALAWYRYNRKEWPEAGNWFMTSLDWAETSKVKYVVPDKTIEGYALSLQNQDKLEEAEAVAYSAIDRGAKIRQLYVNIVTDELNKTDQMTVVTPPRLERFGAVVATDHSMTGAQALAWYYYRGQNWAQAVDWFKSAVTWAPDGKGDAKINEGYALSLKGAGRFEEAENIAYDWRDRAPAMRAVYMGIVIDQMNKPEYAEKMTEPRVQRFEGVVVADRSDDGAQALGWFRYGQRGKGYGINWFKQAVEWSPARRDDTKTNEGYAAALRLVGRLTEAEAIAYPFVSKTELMKKLYVEIVVEELTHDNPPEPVPEQRIANFVAIISPDMNPLGAQALGWYRLERHENQDAVKWFRDALDWWPPQENLVHANQKTFEDYKAILARLAMIHEQYRKSPRAYTSTATLLGRDNQSYIDTIEGYTKTMEGYAQALREAGDTSAAETIAFDWRDRSPGLRELFINIAVSELTRDNSMAAIEPERMTRYVTLIEADHSIAGAQALAWHASARKQWEASANWFKVSLDWAANTSFEQKIDPKIAEGYVAAMRNLGKLDEAEKLAYDWRDRSTAMRKIYIETAVEQIRNLKPGVTYPPERLSRLLMAVNADKSSPSAQAMGWYFYAQKDYEKALNWFRSSSAWTADGKGDPKSMEGYVATLKSLGRLKEAAAMAFDWRERTPEMRALYINTFVELLTKDTKGDSTPEDQLRSFADVVTTDHSAVGAQALGWYRYAQTGNGFAVDWFKNSIEWSADGKADAKTNEGYALALRATGRLAEAEAVVYPWVANVDIMRTLYINIMVEEMTKDLPPEPVSEPRLAQYINVITPIKSALGAQALAWYRHERNEDTEGAKWFKLALDWWPTLSVGNNNGNTKAAFVEDYQPILGKLALTHENYRRTPRAYSNPATNAGKYSIEYVKTAEGIAKTWEGYALTLRATGRLAEAEQIAYDWRDKWPSLRKLYLDMAVAALTGGDTSGLTPDRMAHFTEVIESDHSLNGAQAIGWYFNGQKQWTEATNWFKHAIDWRAPNTNDPKLDLKLYEGYINALRGGGQFDEALAIATSWRDKSPEMQKLYMMTAIDSLQNPNATGLASATLIDQLGKYATTGKSADGAQALGWYYYAQKDYAHALNWFQNDLTWAGDKADGKAVEGYVLTLRASGKMAEAMNFAFDWRDRATNMRELYIELSADMLSKEGATIPADVLTKTALIVNADHNAKGAQALGWYRLARKEYPGALEFFKNAMAWSIDGKGDAKMSEGYARALRGTGRLDEAENAAYAWAEDADAMRALYIEIVAERLSRTTSPTAMNEDSLRRFAAAVTRDSSASGAQALAWYSFNVNQVSPAVAWFEKSLAYEPSEGAALGLALCYKKLRDNQSFMRVIETYRDRYGKVADLVRANYKGAQQQPLYQQQAYQQPPVYAQPAPVYAAPRPAPKVQVAARPAAPANVNAGAGASSSALSAALSKKDNVGCLKIADNLDRAGHLTAADSANRGWCLLAMGRAQESALAFDRGIRGGLTGSARDNAAYGKSLALLRNGASGEAAAAANQSTLSPAKRNDVGMQVLDQQIRAAYANEQYAIAIDLLNRRASFAPETRDMMMTRGWALYKLGQYDGARRLFKAVDSQMSTSESQSALSTVESRLLGK